MVRAWWPLLLIPWGVLGGVPGTDGGSAGPSVLPTPDSADHSSVIRVIGGSLISEKSLPVHAPLLAQLLRDTVIAKTSGTVNLVYLVFAGDLFGLFDVPVLQTPTTDLLRVFVTGAESWWGDRYGEIRRIRASLLDLERLGVQVFWLPGAHEGSLTQKMLETINGGPVTWLTIPQESSITLHRTLISSGREVDFFSYPSVNQLSLTTYLQRLAATPITQLSPACPDVERLSSQEGCRSTIRATRQAISEAIKSSPSTTLAQIQNPAFVKNMIARSLQFAAGSTNCSLDSLEFQAGDWRRIISLDGYHTSASRTVSAESVAEHYSSLGISSVQHLGEDATTNLFYATANGDIRPLLPLALTKHDAAVVGHAETTSIRLSDVPLIRLGRWIVTRSNALSSDHGGSSSDGSTAADSSTTDSTTRPTSSSTISVENSPCNAPSATFTDVTVAYVENLSLDRSDLRVIGINTWDLLNAAGPGPVQLFSWRPAAGKMTVLLYTVGGVVGLAFIAILAVTIVVIVRRKRRSNTDSTTARIGGSGPDDDVLTPLRSDGRRSGGAGESFSTDEDEQTAVELPSPVKLDGEAFSDLYGTAFKPPSPTAANPGSMADSVAVTVTGPAPVDLDRRRLAGTRRRDSIDEEIINIVPTKVALAAKEGSSSTAERARARSGDRSLRS